MAQDALYHLSEVLQSGLCDPPVLPLVIYPIHAKILEVR